MRKPTATAAKKAKARPKARKTAPAPAGAPVPDDALAELDDAGQLAVIEGTANHLAPEDEALPQPPQDGTYVPEAG